MTYNPDNPDEGFEQHGRTQGARACAWKTNCRCTHTNCWDGFLDAETIVDSKRFYRPGPGEPEQPLLYTKVHRCGQCAIARDIAAQISMQKAKRAS